MIGINEDHDLEVVKKAKEEHQINWRSFIDEKAEEGSFGSISERWDVKALPTFYVLDAKGVIRFKSFGVDFLPTAIETILAEMGHEVDLSEVEEGPVKPEDK